MPQSVVRFNAPVASVSAHDLPNAPQSAPERHFRLPYVIYPNYKTPQFTPDVDRLLAAIDRLTCCPACAHRWVSWVVEGRFGPDYPAALAAIVLAMATQHEEAQP
jgi:hypothetical protein